MNELNEARGLLRNNIKRTIDFFSLFSDMVLINIQRLIHLIQETNACPFGFPERQSLLWRAYSSYEETPGTEFVSISTNQDWRFLDERKLEEEDEECRKSIVQELVERFTRSKTTVPVLRTIIYLVPSA